MKTKQEIVERAIILNALWNRCGLETEMVGGDFYDEQERERRRINVLEWLQDKGYYDSVTAEEKRIFEQPVSKHGTKELWSKEFQCKASDALLWALGLVPEMSDYLHFPFDDRWDLLQIGSEHTKEKLMASCVMRSRGEMEFETDLACLWHWRAMEIGSTPPNGQSWRECILSIFGEECAPLLDEIPWSKKAPGDFLVGKKTVSQFNKTEEKMFYINAYWRHYGLEWITSDAAWDEVSVDT